MKRIGIAIGCVVASMSVAAQSVSFRPVNDSTRNGSPAVSTSKSLPAPAQKHAHMGVVSDWTRNHVLFPTPRNLSLALKLQNDPRYMQSWYLRHHEAWWPGVGRGHFKVPALVHRDWSVTLGTTTLTGIPTFQPMFDFNYSLSGAFETGYGTLNTSDLIGSHQASTTGGAYWATSGTVNVTATDDVGVYPLTPGGPGTETQTEVPAGPYNFNNVLFPSYPALAPIFTGFDGVSFGNPVGGNNLLFVESGGTVYNDVYDGGNFAGAFTGTPGTNINIDPGGGQTFPAKYTFDVTASPNCTSDFVAMGIPANAVAGSSGQANIVGYNELYTNSTGTGYCPTLTGPAVKFAYASGSGEVPGSVSISLDGSQLAYVEDLLTGSSVFHVLTIGTASEGTSPTDPVTPGAGGSNAVDTTLALAGGSGSCPAQSSTTSPYIDLDNNSAYVTTYAWTGAGTGTGCLYKISNIFVSTGGTSPTIAWSIPITGAVPSSPVVDAATSKVFFTDSAGNIDVVDDTGTPSTYSSLAVAAGTTSENPVTIDNANSMVYATFNTNGSDALVVQAPESLASSASVSVGLGNTLYTGPYGVDFNNAWYTGGPTAPGALLYVAGNDTNTGTVPTLYNVGFGAVTAGVMNTTANPSTPLATTTNSATLAATVADSSAVSEFFNANDTTGGPDGTDYLFVGVTDSCAATAGGNAGCVMSLNITSGAPTVSGTTTAIAAPGGSTGIVVDNEANTTAFPQASSAYYGTKNGGTLVKATQNGLD